ncbi:phosphorylase family protein [Endozoicomonadaceae bacterium StTr2]
MIVALEKEAIPLISRFGLKPFAMPDPKLPCRAYTGRYKGLELSLVLCGKDPEYKVSCIGSVPAALATLEAIRCFQPELIINPGTSGAFGAKGSHIGQVYISQKIRFYDRRINVGAAVQAWGEGNFSCSLTSVLARETGLSLAVVCTGDSVDMSPVDRDILESEPVVVKEMEAAAVARVASLYGIPVFAVKVVTDLLDNSESIGSQFRRNFNLAADNLCNEMEKILLRIARS